MGSGGQIWGGGGGWRLGGTGEGGRWGENERLVGVVGGEN